ncbi:MAG: RNA polymerase sigma factor [Marinifilaceae bacterium]
MAAANQFIKDINDGNERAWEKLYAEFYPSLCRYVAKLLKDDNGVEDIVQECLINLWKSPPHFSDISMLTGWLYRSVYTRTLNYIRDTKRSRLKQEQYYCETDLPEERGYELAIEECAITQLYSEIQKLSPQQGTIMQLTIEGLKVAEIAEKLSVSENTIKMQKKRAYATLRANIGVIALSYFLLLQKNKKILVFCYP